MSSILKALKKIDETSQPAQAFPSLPEAIDAKKAVTASAKKRWVFRRWITVALILLAVAAAGVILLQKRLFFRDRPRLQASSAAAVTPRVNRPVFRSKIRTAPAAAITRTDGKGLAPMPVKAETIADRRAKLTTTRPASTGQPSPQTPGASRTNLTTSPGVQKTPAKSRTTYNPPVVANKFGSGKRARTRQTVTRPQKTARKKTAVISSYDRLGSSVLKLQALAWSNDIARRLAVINGHVLHEGEAVEGYQVTQIRQQDVIVSDGQKSWRLVFGLQQ